MMHSELTSLEDPEITGRLAGNGAVICDNGTSLHA